MRSNYLIENLKDISQKTVKAVIENSDLLLTVHGEHRSVVRLIGAVNLESILVIDVKNIETTQEITKNIERLTLENKLENSIKISIDISLISRKNLAEIISILAKSSKNVDIELNILYSLAKYSPPTDDLISNSEVMPVSRFYAGWPKKPGLPVMSIVGLGYEKDKALGAIEYVESSKAVLYLPNSEETSYRNDVEKENENILRCVPKEDKVNYSVESPVETIYSIDSLLSANKASYKVVLFPFGPKIFYASSLIASIPHPETSVWYVSGEEKDNNASQDRECVSFLGFSCKINYETRK